MKILTPGKGNGFKVWKKSAITTPAALHVCRVTHCPFHIPPAGDFTMNVKVLIGTALFMCVPILSAAQEEESTLAPDVLFCIGTPDARRIFIIFGP